MSEKQEFYIGDKPLVEVSSGVFAPFEVTGVFTPGDQKSFGQYRYTVSPVNGRGEMTVTASKLSK